jgi:uncharacterized protein (TIGR03067 family)
MRLFVGLVLVMGMFACTLGRLAADDPNKEQAIKRDRMVYQGTWRVVSLEINGTKSSDDDARKITVANDGETWIIYVDNKEVLRGTSKIDPTKTPKTIDFVPSTGNDSGKTFLGIYAIKGDSRKLCFAGPGQERPTQFVSKTGSNQVLVLFHREKK